MPSTETKQLLAAAVAACEDKKAEDIRILALDPAESGLTDYFLICNGTNERQNVAITDEIEIRLKREFGVYPNSVEGRRQAEWILLDYTDIVIHVFLAEKRAFYDIERLRKSARNLTGAEVEAELKSALAKKTIAVRKSSPKTVDKTVNKTVEPLSKQAIHKTASSQKRGTNVTAKKAAKKVAKKAAVKAVKPAANTISRAKA